MIEAIFFDGDQTLWDFQLVMRRALTATLAELRRLRPGPADGLDIESMITDRDQVAAELRGVETNLERIRHAAFARTLRRIGIPDEALAAQLNAIYLEHRFADVELFPDVRPALRELGSRYRLGLLSNGNSYPERCGLDGVFEAVVFSQDHGAEKPDRHIYDIAAAQLGKPAKQLVMIGDSLTNDVYGAEQAGWRGIWLNRDGAPAPDGVEQIRDLREVLSVVA